MNIISNIDKYNFYFLKILCKNILNKSLFYRITSVADFRTILFSLFVHLQWIRIYFDIFNSLFVWFHANATRMDVPWNWIDNGNFTRKLGAKNTTSQNKILYGIGKCDINQLLSLFLSIQFQHYELYYCFVLYFLLGFMANNSFICLRRYSQRCFHVIFWCISFRCL